MLVLPGKGLRVELFDLAAQLTAPDAALLPEYTLRRDPADGDSLATRDERAIERARRRIFFQSGKPSAPWTRTDPTPAVWSLVQELRALEGVLGPPRREAGHRWGR